MPTFPRPTKALSIALLALALPYAAHAADSGRGRLLYENHCMTCHESVVHIRSDRKARSAGEVTWQISRWATELKLDWRYGEIADVLDYLNTQFYRFEKPTECP